VRVDLDVGVSGGKEVVEVCFFDWFDEGDDFVGVGCW